MSRRRDDEGSVLLLVVGLAVVLLLMVAVVVNVSAVILAKRGLSSAVDGAAVAAAQQPDADALRQSGLASHLPLDPVAVEDVVATYEQDERVGQPGIVLVANVEPPATAVVDGRRIVQLPFGGWLGIGQVLVRAQGRAQSPVLP